MSICEFCSSEFSSKSIGIHLVNCEMNPKIEEIKRKRRENRQEKVELNNSFKKPFKKKCDKCQIEFEVIEDERTYPKKEKYYCSRKCANSRGKMTDETKVKIGLARAKRIKIKYCKHCNKEIKSATRKIFCTDECRKNSKQHISRSYRYYCNFDFDVNEYPDYFDLTLIEKFGLYRPSNSSKGSNLNGISKDHLLSISEGSKLNISPKIMKHPANCRLIRHNDNISKGSKSTITLEELIKRINIFEQKYGDVALR